MKSNNYMEIPLVEIGMNPRNPRKKFSGPKFDEFLVSVKEKGVIEPIIVRPIGQAGAKYQIVAGERRFRAAEKAGHETIPAIVRQLTDEQAFDFMLIENLQREDLTELEEAQSFKLYVGKHGEKGITELASKTGISPQYIRRRMAVLELPATALKAWEQGKLRYGHLEQLLRVKDSPEFKRFLKEALEEDRWKGQTTVEELKRGIDNQSPSFKLAYFPFEEECRICPKNSTVQMGLFGFEGGKAGHCLDPACFKKKQNDWLLGHWKESALGKKYGTNGFRFQDKVGYNDHETVYHPDAKCKACPHFLTVIDSVGEVSYNDGQECFNKACLRARERQARGEERSKKAQERKPGEPRVSWHGEYFRDAFLKKRLPDVLMTFDPDDEKIKTLLMITALHENSTARDIVWEALKVKAGDRWNIEGLYKRILALPYAAIRPLVLETVKSIVMEGPNVGKWNGFGTENRMIVSRFVGIDLGKEWSMTEEYLQKKTKAEILEIGKKFKIFSDPKAKAYLQRKFKGREPKALKKGELVDFVLKSGVELVGKVPMEILKEKHDLR